jgi:hypothetical protein
MDRSMGVAQTPLMPLSNPQGFDSLQAAMMNKVAGNQLPQAPQQKPQQQQMPQIGSIGGQPVNPVWQQALGQLAGKVGG